MVIVCKKLPLCVLDRGEISRLQELVKEKEGEVQQLNKQLADANHANHNEIVKLHLEVRWEKYPKDFWILWELISYQLLTHEFSFLLYDFDFIVRRKTAETSKKSNQAAECTNV